MEVDALISLVPGLLEQRLQQFQSGSCTILLSGSGTEGIAKRELGLGPRS